MTTKDIILSLIAASSTSVYYNRNGEIIEWRESDSDASLAVEFGKEVFEIEITVRKR